MKLRDCYAALHRITGGMAMLGVNDTKLTNELIKEWIKSLSDIIKEMKTWKMANSKSLLKKPKKTSRASHPKKKRK